jgi:hypothetical protein
VTGQVALPAPPLRSGGEAALQLPGVVQPDGEGWRLLVTAELTGDGWAEDLGAAAHASQDPQPAGDSGPLSDSLARDRPPAN